MDKQPQNKRRRVLLIIFAVIFALCGLAWFLYWLFIGRFYVSTEDAYVHGNQMQITTQVDSGVKAIFAEETDFVEEGQLIVEMESANYVLAYEETQRVLANTVREVAALFQKVAALEAMLLVREAELRLARLDLSIREGLVETGAISFEEFESYKTSVETASARKLETEELLAEAKVHTEATTVRTHPRVLEARTKMKEAYLDLIRCRVLSPVSGYVAKRGVQIGDWVEAGTTMMMVVPLDRLWMEANYKETKLSKVRVGQPVTFWADLHGSSVKYSGKVMGYQAGTGTAFSILPAQNASGNWIKIVQRVPIRVEISKEELEKHPLIIGLSLHAKIDVHDDSGPMLRPVPTFEPIYHTPIYQTQMEQMENIGPVIDTIIEDNLPQEYR